MGLGWLLSGVLFAALMALPALLNLKIKLNPVFAFWWAYIMTRPLGASFADWVAVPRAQGGLGLGTGAVTLALSVLILVLVLMVVFGKGRFGDRRLIPPGWRPNRKPDWIGAIPFFYRAIRRLYHLFYLGPTRKNSLRVTRRTNHE